MSVAWISIAGVGILLGRNFRVFVLAPAFAADAIVISTASIAHKIPMFEAAKLIFLTLVCLQMGYLIGLFTRSAACESQAQNHPTIDRPSQTILPFAK
ncbi:hypothetical protein [Bradyrhizobium lablabi]|uniref:hypothetical protein n=1 Tax=Bradyrhizobium lablabi TaxID=722472 RepID=UPI0012AB69FB|nr:hypothetical protein [Bradyrhizobium lablabi]